MVYLLDVSMIIPIALVILSVIVLGPCKGNKVKFILKVSFPSTMLSFVIVMFTVALFVPAMIVTICVAEL